MDLHATRRVNTNVACHFKKATSWTLLHNCYFITEIKNMKKILILLSFIYTNSIGQGNQTIQKGNIKVNCECHLKVNNLFIDMSKQQGVTSIINALVCANEDEPFIVNINIYDETSSYKQISPANYHIFDERFINGYAINLDGAGIDYKISTYKGSNSVEYNFTQNRLPTKAIYFIKDKRSYLIQIGSVNNLQSKFNNLKNTFTITN
jgi:hypothetical protein